MSRVATSRGAVRRPGSTKAPVAPNRSAGSSRSAGSRRATGSAGTRPSGSGRSAASSRKTSGSVRYQGTPPSRATRGPGFYKKLIICLCVLLALIAGGWLVWVSPVLGVKQVRVEGSTLTAVSDVRAQANIRAGTPLVRVDLEEVAARVAALPPVASAEVTRSWPNSIVVRVTERVPLAVVTVAGATWAIDKTGTVYLRAGQLPAAARAASAIALDVQSPGPKDPATRAALAVLQSLPRSVRNLTDSIEAPSAAEVTLNLKDGRTVIWGGADSSAAKARLVPILLKQTGTVFDVSTPSAVVIR